MRHLPLLGLMVASSIGLGYASIQLQTKMQPPRLSMKEMIAIRRMDAHDAAVKRNTEARQSCEVARAIRQETFDVLYGEFPATLGDAFDITEYWHESGAVTMRTERRGDRLVDTRALVTKRMNECSPSEDPEVFCPFRCQADPHDDCAKLGWQLGSQWGWHDGVWRDGANSVQARLVETTECELRFQKYVEPAAWIAMTTTAEVPLALIGEPASRLPSYAGYPRRGGDAGWPLFVTGDHMLEATISVFVENGRIVGFWVAGEMEAAGGADELYAIVGRYLRSPLHVTLETSGTTFDLTVGDVRR